MKFTKIPRASLEKVASSRPVSPRELRRMEQEAALEKVINLIRVGGDGARNAFKIELDADDKMSTVRNRFVAVTTRLEISDVVLRKYGNDFYIHSTVRSVE